MSLLVRCLGTAAALWAVVHAVDGVHVVSSGGDINRFFAFLASALVIVLLNMTVRPVLQLIGLPLTILSLGFFALVINGVIFLFAGTVSSWFGAGLVVDDFHSAFFGALVLGIVNWVLGPLTSRLS